MNTAPGTWKGRADVLSSDEERVLSDVREIVRRIRAEGKTVDLASLGQSVGDAGAIPVGFDADAGSREFDLRGIRFFLQPAPGAGVEIHFPAATP
jgi:hypothetical protein